MNTLCNLVLAFALYSFIGWVMESVFCSALARKIVKRGFLNGPYCPIYGFGALLDVLLLGWVENPVALFFAGMLVTGTLEYATAWLLEALFHAKWWDYSDKKFNLQGRVCLSAAAAFGALSVLVVKVLHPLALALFAALPRDLLLMLTGAVVAVFLIDTAATVVHLKNFNQKLFELQQRADSLLQASIGRVEPIKRAVDENLQQMRRYLTGHERRTLSAFPKFTSTRYKEAVEALRRLLKNEK